MWEHTAGTNRTKVTQSTKTTGPVATVDLILFQALHPLYVCGVWRGKKQAYMSECVCAWVSVLAQRWYYSRANHYMKEKKLHLLTVISRPLLQAETIFISSTHPCYSPTGLFRKGNKRSSNKQTKIVIIIMAFIRISTMCSSKSTNNQRATWSTVKDPSPAQWTIPEPSRMSNGFTELWGQ